MHIPFRHSLLAALIIGIPMLQACSDNETPEQQAIAEKIVEQSQKNKAIAAEESTASGIDRSMAPEGAKATILSPADGDTVTSPVTVEFGLEGMDVVPAGTEQEHAGHHHLLIDLDKDALPPMDFPLPANDNVVHFGKGQTQTELELEPGTHTLQLLLGDHMHVPHEPPVMSEKITITVE
ncbi:DUF4399 domain-containing protein [Alcanivorax jadensis]|uniref:DUF4399 domain-containing protein n=1 Tax=Alcanivorax jadensis TaxID=64988 RepID=UPI0026EBC1A1|nr:DUF4399 domain-containing protein [Alcanivorax jadensis]